MAKMAIGTTAGETAWERSTLYTSPSHMYRIVSKTCGGLVEVL